METVLLTLALATCIEEPTKCSVSTTEKGAVLVTACGLAPDREGRPITLEGKIEGKEYIVTLEPKCSET